MAPEVLLSTDSNLGKQQDVDVAGSHNSTDLPGQYPEELQCQLPGSATLLLHMTLTPWTAVQQGKPGIHIAWHQHEQMPALERTNGLVLFTTV